MTQEVKELLLKDLCARLPYGVKIKLGDYAYQVCGYNSEEKPLPLKIWYYYSNNSKSIIDVYLEDYYPYLRPLSSITEEEKKEFCKIEGRVNFPCKYIKLTFSVDELDWLNAHHFDYRKSYDPDRKEWLSMIERGLAVEVTKENNPYDGLINTYQGYTDG